MTTRLAPVRAFEGEEARVQSGTTTTPFPNSRLLLLRILCRNSFAYNFNRSFDFDPSTSSLSRALVSMNMPPC